MSWYPGSALRPPELPHVQLPTPRAPAPLLLPGRLGESPEERIRRLEEQIAQLRRALQEQQRVASATSSELAQARFQVDSTTQALEITTRRLGDASAHWEHELMLERQRCVQATIALQEQALLMRNALDAERAARGEELQKTRQISARLDATQEELSQKRNELTAVERRTVEAQSSAEFSLNQMEDCMRKTLTLWQRNRDEEVGELKRSLESVKLGSAGGVSADEANRSLMLVATLWHSAGRKETRALTPDVEASCAESALNAWRIYFHRDAGAELPLLKPTSNLVLAPLRAAAGARASEVLGNEPPPMELGWRARPPTPSAPLPQPL